MNNPGYRFDFTLPALVSRELEEDFTTILRNLQSSMTSIARKYAQIELENRQLKEDFRNQGRQMERMKAEVEVAAKGGGKGYATNANGIRAVENLGFTSRDAQRVSLHDSPVHSVTFTSPDDSETLMATASWDGKAKLYSLTKKTVVRSLTPPSNPARRDSQGLYCVSFAKTNPNIVGASCCDYNIYLWDYNTGRLRETLTKHTNEVNSIDFHEMQPVLCTAGDDCQALVWDFEEGVCLRALDKHTKAVYGCSFLGQTQPMQYWVATCSFDSITRIFDMRDRNLVHSFDHHSDEGIGLSFSPETWRLATSSDDGTIQLYDPRKLTALEKIDTKTVPGLERNEVKRMAFSPNGKYLAAGGAGGNILVYEMDNPTKGPVARLAGHTECVFDVAWTRSNALGCEVLASASHDNTTQIWTRI